MKPTADLMNEHKAIRLMISVMSNISNSIKENKVFYTNDVEKIVDFLSVYADKCHRTKEESVFFPALLMTDYPSKKMPVGLLINEHLIAKGYLEEILSSSVNCKLGSTFSCDRIADCMANYVELIDNHMQKEEEDFFPLANKALSEEAQIEISKQFKMINDEFLGMDVHDHYDELLKLMESKYLNK
jgi:hemerythrin-like domain-containing protein